MMERREVSNKTATMKSSCGSLWQFYQLQIESQKCSELSSKKEFFDTIEYAYFRHYSIHLLICSILGRISETIFFYLKYKDGGCKIFEQQSSQNTYSL